MVEKTKYRLWLKLRIGKSLDTEDDALTVSIAGRTVTIESEKRGEPLSKTSWLVMSCRGFETEAQARKFGRSFDAQRTWLGCATGWGWTLATLAKTVRCFGSIPRSSEM